MSFTVESSLFAEMPVGTCFGSVINKVVVDRKSVV